MGVQLQYDGWPVFVTEEGKGYATEAVAELFDKCEVITASMADDAIFKANDKYRPECLRGVAVWDAREAVVDRAIRAANGETVYRRSFFGNEMRKYEFERRIEEAITTDPNAPEVKKCG